MIAVKLEKQRLLLASNINMHAIEGEMDIFHKESDCYVEL